MGKILIGIFAIIAVVGIFASSITDGIGGLRTDPTTEAFVVVTGAGVSSANVTLVSDPFQDDLTNITTVTSNATETPLATTYTTATNVLLITALDTSTTRTLTIAFLTETTDAVWSALGPFMTLLIIGGLVGLIFWAMLSKKKGHN